MISIIIPAYNIEAYLPEALNSVLAQRYDDWEAIIVDDGSTDMTGNIADEYAQQDARFHVFHQTNLGVAAARNKAMDAINGDWFCFLDGDDFWHPDYLSCCSQIIDKCSELTLLCFGHLFSENPVFEMTPIDNEPQIVSCRDKISARIWNNGLWETLYKRDLFGHRRFKPFTFAEDILFYRQCLLECSDVCLFDVPLYAYRKRQGSAMCSAMTARKIKDSLFASAECFESLLASGKQLEDKYYRQLMRSIFEWPLLWYFHLQNVERETDFLATWKKTSKNVVSFGNIPLWYYARYLGSYPFKHLFPLYVLMAFPLEMVLVLVKFRDGILRSHKLI